MAHGLGEGDMLRPLEKPCQVYDLADYDPSEEGAREEPGPLSRGRAVGGSRKADDDAHDGG